MGRGLCAVVALLVVAPAQAATVTLGTTSGNCFGALFTQAYAFQTAVGPGSPAYAVPAGSWTITSWSVRTHNGGGIRLKVFRPVGGGQYVVAAQSPIQTAAGGGGASSFSTYLAVQGGDLLGVQDESDSACLDVGVSAATMSMGDSTNPQPGEPPFTPQYSDFPSFRLMLSATLSSDGPAKADPQPPGRSGYCSPAGVFLDLVAGQPGWDPAYADAVPARYEEGAGATCDPPSAGYVDSGFRVDGSGKRPYSGDEAGYEYWAPAGAVPPGH